MSEGNKERWKTLMCSDRCESADTGGVESEDLSASNADHRVAAERDYDRILFCTPTRRLADKTQVFPLEQNDSVRTRLTHSLEVSNLARSIGVRLMAEKDWLKEEIGRAIPATLAAAGLCHDLGNPPFGHRGELSIAAWFEEHCELLDPLRTDLRNEFLGFEGNAQTFRIIGRLQHPVGRKGLGLTFATLAAVTKYPVFVGDTKEDHCAMKKHGFWESERPLAERMLERVGLGLGRRHPLAYIVEACDDICYSMIDAEDSVKKGIVSVHDLLSHLRSWNDKCPTIKSVVEAGIDQCQKCRRLGISSEESDDVATQRIRVDVIARSLDAVFQTFIKHEKDLLEGGVEKSLIALSPVKDLIKGLKQFDKTHGYDAHSVRRLELRGHHAIRDLMTSLWTGIKAREDQVALARGSACRKREDLEPISKPFAAYAYSRISEGYRRVFEDALLPSNNAGARKLPDRYYSLQLLSDMIAGTTDRYLMTLQDDLDNAGQGR